MLLEWQEEDFSYYLGPIMGPRYRRVLIEGRIPSLGSGSFGTLHLAFDMEMGEMVALKLFPRDATEFDEGTPVCPSDILKEGIVTTSRNLRHRSLVFGRHYFVEDVDSKANHIAFGLCGYSTSENGYGFGYRHATYYSDKDLPRAHIKQCLGICDSVCDALMFLHSNGIIHCDVKPANIIISSASSRAILCDLGSCYVKNDEIFKSANELDRYQYWRKLCGLRH